MFLGERSLPFLKSKVTKKVLTQKAEEEEKHVMREKMAAKYVLFFVRRTKLK